MPTGPATHALRFAVRGPVVLRYTGTITLVVAGLTLAPTLAATLTGETAAVLLYLAVMVGLGSFGVLVGRLPKPHRMQTNEALVVATVAFLIAALSMTLPMMAFGLSFIDALFESVSGVTTTGLSTLASVEDKSRAFLFLRAWMQWYGGLGMVVFAVALAIPPGAGARGLRLDDQEAHDAVGSTRAYFRGILGVYATITAATIIALCAAGSGTFDALTFALASVSTGGFSPYDDSLASLGDAARIVILCSCVTCSISLVLYRRAARAGRDGWRTFAGDGQLRMLAALALLAALTLLALWRFDVAPAGNRPVFDALTMAISAQTTTGFSSLEVERLSNASKLVLIVQMFLGASYGSTGGGVKLLRVLILLALVNRFFARASSPPDAVVTTRVDGEKLSEHRIEDALTVIGAFAATVAVSLLCFLAAGYGPLDSLFEVVSATGTVGLSTGITAPALPATLKLVLCADMLLGRLEILAWLVLLWPRTWIGRKATI